jgi:glycosyltransferase involved in cell wall biosynthesis
MTETGLKIGLVGPLPPPSGGMANQARQLAELLGREGVEVVVVRTNAPYRPGWVGAIRGLRAVFRLLPYVATLWRVAGRVQLLHVMANSGWSWHLVAAPAIWIARARGVPVVVNYRGGGAEAFLDRSRKLLGISLGRANALVVPSPFLKEVFARHGFSSQIVPNIVDVERFAPRPAGTTRAAGPHVVVTRNLEPVYGIDVALRAFQRVRTMLPAARMSVAGSGPERGRLEALAASLGIGDAIAFTGRIDNEHIGELYRSADVFLNPSHVDNMPISVLEALASGVPVVSTNVGGVPYIVRDERTALLVPPGDDERMGDAIVRLARDTQLRSRLAAEGLEIARQYAWPRVRDLWLAVYRNTISTGHGTALRPRGS